MRSRWAVTAGLVNRNRAGCPLRDANTVLDAPNRGGHEPGVALGATGDYRDVERE